MPPTVCSALIISFLLAFSALPASAQLLQSQLQLSPDQQSQLRDLASRVLKHADSAGCKKSCTILVANFTGESGSTSALGMQLADEVSAQLSSQAGGGIQIASRRNLQQYLEKERIPSKLLEDDNAARWLATENGATVVLVGFLKVGLTQASLHVQLLDTSDFGKRDGHGKTFVEEETFQDISNFGSFGPAEPFGEPHLSGSAKEARDSLKSAAGHKVSPPHCPSHPDPPYTRAAEKVKEQGTITLQVLISKEGQITDVQILKGLPFGLNERALETVRKWRCQPSIVDGQPVPTLVPIEITFRLF